MNPSVAGVDGCKGGWIIAIAADTSDGDTTTAIARVEITMHVVETFIDVVDVTRACSVVGVDMPLALPISGVRASDTELKEYLGPNGRSLFWTPTRDAIDQSSHATAVRVNKAAGGKGPSAQGWGLASKIREVRTALLPNPDPRMVEVHPESSFVALAGQPLPSKRTAQGVGRRLAALAGWCANVEAALASVPLEPGRPAIDDALDAMAAAWTAQRIGYQQAQWFGDRHPDDQGFVAAVAV